MKLSKEELQQLIDNYRTELRLLTYRSQQVSDTLKDLEKSERAAKPKGKRGRPAKKAAGKRGRPAKKAAGKRGRPAKKVAGKRGRPAKKVAGKRGRPAKKVAAKRGRPAKKVAAKRGRPAKKAAGKRGRPAKSAPAKAASGDAKGYRLNVWDQIIMKSIGSKKKPGVFSDFFAAAKKHKDAAGLSDKAIYARINQSIHKLANKRNVLNKVNTEGRGFAYTIA